MLKAVTDIKEVESDQNKPTPVTIISVFVLRIFSKRLQHGIWLSRMENRAVQKKILAKIDVAF